MTTPSKHSRLKKAAVVVMALAGTSLFAASAGSVAGPPSYATGAGPVSVAIGDLNGDGKPDVVTANLYANTISVLVNGGDGTFPAKRDYRSGGDPRSIATGDLNGDGRLDIVTVSADANAASVFLNKGDATFSPTREYTPGSGPLSVAIADLNRDGKQDLVASGRAYAVSVLLNNGKAAFRHSREYRTGKEPVAVAVAELNGDGKPDLVAVNADANTVSVLLNRGGGTFQSRRDDAVGTHPIAVAVGDLNGDGKPDVATADLDANTVSVLLNSGDGILNKARAYRAGGDPRAIAIGDIDGDRKPDIVTANADVSTVSVLLNRGDGVFGPPRNSGTGPHPVAIAIGDLDRDGRPEVLTANLGAGTVSVLHAHDLTVGNAAAPPAPPAPPAPGLLLWNKLGSTYEVTHSAYGPNLVFFECKDRATPTHGHCGSDVQGTLVYPKGVFGGGAAIGGGPYVSAERVHTAALRASILNPEHGAVELWYRQVKNSVPFEHDQYRFFGGPYSLAGIDEANLYSTAGRLHFALFFGEEPPPFAPPHLVEVRSKSDGAVGYGISKVNGRWIHLAGVWDRRGIAGSHDTVRLYVDGKIVAAARARNWGTTPCGRRVAARPGGACFIDVAGCNDKCANSFAVDNLKLWSFAKTDYGDRFHEGF